MKAIKFEQANRNLVAPGCFDLPVYTDDEQCVSCWELSAEELAAILETGKVWLYIVSGGTQPPVRLSIENPFAEATNDS